MKKIEYLKVILILPANVIITIPLLIYILSHNFFSFNIISPFNFVFYFSIFSLLIGLWLAIWSVRTFYTKGGEGTPGPWKPVTNLVISGPYRYIRNPMLLGVFFILLFESVFFSSTALFIWFIIFFIGNIIYFKNFEEKDLIQRFGAEYKNYKNNVPMLYPRFTRYK